MSVNLVRCPRFAPLTARILVIADQFLLLGVHGNDRLASPQSVFDGTIDMPELRVAVGMILPFLGLAVTLQAVATLPEELSDLGMTDRMPSSRQFRRQHSSALAGPAQRRLRITARRRLNHRVQGRRQARIVGRQRVSSTALLANPTPGERRRL